jgi:hypothetical protein
MALQMDWVSAGVHRQKLGEWGLDGNPERRMNPFLAHQLPGTVSAEALAQEPDPMDRVQAAVLEALSRPDGQFSPGAGLSSEHLQRVRSRQAALEEAQSQMHAGVEHGAHEAEMKTMEADPFCEHPQHDAMREETKTEFGSEGPWGNVGCGGVDGEGTSFKMPFGMVPGMSIRDWGPAFLGGNDYPYNDPNSPTLRM